MLSEESVEEITDGVEISQKLQRVAESVKDDTRANRITEIRRKIEDLKQLSRDFKGAASRLGFDASELSSGPGAGTATSSVTEARQAAGVGTSSVVVYTQVLRARRVS
jgi:hypothetical protein